MALRKPITMRYSEGVGDQCLSLASEGSKVSEKNLVYLVHLQNVAEDISNAFGYETAQSRLPSMSVEGVALLVKAFEAKLDGMRSSLNADAADDCKFTTLQPCLLTTRKANTHKASLMLAYDNTYIYLYEVCIILSERTQATPEVVHQDLQPTSTTRTNMFITCLDAVKRFFNTYIQLPGKRLRGHSIVEKSQLAHAMVVLVKLPFCTDTGLEANVWQQACDVESCLEALGDRLNPLLNTLEAHEPALQFKESLARIKAWYQWMRYLGTPGAPTDLKTMSPLELMEITRKEPVLDMDLRDLDFSGMDMLWE